LIERINKEIQFEGKDLKLIVGGRPFIVAQDLWKKLDSIDVFAKDVENAVELAITLINEERAG